jgi:hypothetical protein
LHDKGKKIKEEKNMHSVSFILDKGAFGFENCAIVLDSNFKNIYYFKENNVFNFTKSDKIPFYNYLIYNVKIKNEIFIHISGFLNDMCSGANAVKHMNNKLISNKNLPGLFGITVLKMSKGIKIKNNNCKVNNVYKILEKLRKEEKATLQRWS